MKKRGFTLLEMIVVMLIVATLFVLTIPNITGVIESVDNKACDALTKVIETAAVEYRLDYGFYPDSLEELRAAGYISDEQMYCKNGKGISLEDGKAHHD